jgi:glycerol uptake facilitator-like aquaporin
LGTALLLAIVIGSGIMGERLADGNTAIALLGNTLATGAGLVVLITIFGPLSGAHFNPAVTLVFAARRELPWAVAAAYIAVQVLGAILGVWAAHVMFDEPILQISTKLRAGSAQGFSEGVATFGLIATILGSIRFRPDATPLMVGLYITAAYWFTASTSFAGAHLSPSSLDEGWHTPTRSSTLSLARALSCARRKARFLWKPHTHGRQPAHRAHA